MKFRALFVNFFGEMCFKKKFHKLNNMRSENIFGWTHMFVVEFFLHFAIGSFFNDRNQWKCLFLAILWIWPRKHFSQLSFHYENIQAKCLYFTSTNTNRSNRLIWRRDHLSRIVRLLSIEWINWIATLFAHSLYHVMIISIVWSKWK